MKLMINELLRESDISEDKLVKSLAFALVELIEEIEIFDRGCLDQKSRDSQFEYIKKLVGLPNNY